uniref:Pre-rRNA-processing protein RIX1 N-terminal domain-containing protein n=1 Tax=Peronospora matthiolae TaxID=2874970 RepID=A0AAV1TYQ3_9STRA
MASGDPRAATIALARNLLSSVLSLALPSESESDSASLRSFLTQQLPPLREALERHNVLGLVTDGKALTKWHLKLLQLIGGSNVSRCVGWKLMLTTTRQSSLERLETLAVELLERVGKLLKQLLSSKEEDEEIQDATAAACGVAEVLLRHVDRYNPDIRREVLEHQAKLVQPLVALLQSKREGSKMKVVVIAAFDLVATLLRASPNSLRTYAVKIESACAVALFPDGREDGNNEVVAEKAVVCLALLCNASDKPQQVWMSMAQKALEAAHQQLDLFASKRLTVPSTDAMAGKKLWVRGAASQHLATYHRAEATLVRMVSAVSALCELLNARTAIASRGQISEREAQQILPEIVLFARRAMGVRAHEVGKHTGVSDDGVRLPVSVIYAMIPRVYVQALRALSASVERTGLCALRHASKITRVLLLASENVGDGEDLQALADTTAVCVRHLGASTVEKFGVSLLNELATRCKRSLDETTSATKPTNNLVAKLAVQQADMKNNGNKSKKRKRQAAAAATIAALNGGNTFAGQTAFVSMRDEAFVTQTLKAVITAVAGCVSVYGCLLPEDCRSSVRGLMLEAAQHRHKLGSGHNCGEFDPVAVALLSDAVTADAAGSHAANLLYGIQYWQRRSICSGGSLSALQQIALNVGEAMLHPRAPPLTINFEQGVSKEQKHDGFRGPNLKAVVGSTASEDAMEWDGSEHDDSGDEGADDGERIAKEESTESIEPAIVDDEEDEDYDDARPQDSIEEPMEVGIEEEESKIDDEDEEDETLVELGRNCADVEKVSNAINGAHGGEDDDDDDDFPDIVVDDD